MTPLPRRWVALAMFEILRALSACEDVVSGIVFTWAVKGSTVDELLVGDPHGVGRRDVEIQGAAGLKEEDLSARLSSREVAFDVNSK